MKSPQGSSDVDHSRYGSKIAKIIDELRRIHGEDPTARVLVFVQWNELLLKLEAALTHYGVHCVALRGGVADRQRTITAFAEGSKRYALLMAMEHDDSGLNLTCSNHVFFVHPMAAEPEVIRACERQALGRVRRRGQTKDVHLYRFVVSGTVEEAHASRHHEILFPSQPPGI
jgi:SNF2 family DNA or RNA helicase